MNLLTGVALREAVERIASGSRVACAVAFWGQGAERIFGCVGTRPIRVICNLRMGGTNPRVIQTLIDAGVEVRQCNTLHAKVYIGDTEAVITSANASINGLGFEQEDAEWIEVGVIVPADAAIPFFEAIWVESQGIRSEEIQAALAKFLNRQKNLFHGKPIVVTDEESSIMVPPEDSDQIDVRVPSTGGFFGKSLREAAEILLSRENIPMTTREIADELARAGVTTAAARLTDSVSDAMRWAASYGHFVKVEREGRNIAWALPTWPGFANLATNGPRVPKQVTGRGSREHVDRTQAGLVIARSRGVRLGRPEAMTKDRVAIAEKMLAAGMPNKRIVEEIGVSKSRFYEWLQKRASSTAPADVSG